MPIPRVAIVGRPNVGKSSLLNLIAHEKIAIVDDFPGVTRDRVGTILDLDAPGAEGPPKPVEVIDTGGYGVYMGEGQRFDEVGNDLTRLTASIEQQIGEAARSADVILFAVDAQAGVTPGDWEIAKLLRERTLGRGDEAMEGGKRRRRGSDGGGGAASERMSESANEGGDGTDQSGSSQAAPHSIAHSLNRSIAPQIRVVATKVDSLNWEAHGLEASGLGFGEPLMVSSTTKYLRRAFLDALYELVPMSEGEDERVESADLKIAIVGKRNAGKSSLINALAGEDRVIVSEIPGTTRDAIDVRFDIGEQSVVAIDTAGLRRKKSFQGRVEHFAFDRAQRAILRADVVVLVIDATEKVSQVDEHLAQIINASYKPCVIAVNKWDLVAQRAGRDGKPLSVEHYGEYLRKELKGLAIAPIAVISAHAGTNIRELIDLCFDIKDQAEERVGTGKLNRILRGVIETRGPANALGTQVKVFFVSQVRSSPPTIVMIVNRPDLFTANYQRFLLNRLREALPFEEVPIRLIIRARRHRDLDLERGDAVDTAGHNLDDELQQILRELPQDAESYFED